MPTLGLLRVLPPWMGRRPLPAKVSLRERSHHAGSDNEPSEQSAAAVRLYWIPLGAGLDVVRLTVARLSGNVFEAVSALARQRPPCDLYHAALEVSLPGRRFVIEMTGAPDRHGCKRGVVCQGAMSAPWLGRFRLFRYEVRCWPGGTIPDAKYAVVPRTARSSQAATSAKKHGQEPGHGSSRSQTVNKRLNVYRGTASRSWPTALPPPDVP